MSKWHDNFKNGLAERVAKLVEGVHKKKNSAYQYIIAPSSTFGKNFVPRLAASLDVQPISDVTQIISSDTFKRPIYAGNAIATVKSNDKVKVMTVRPTSFNKVGERKDGKQATVEKVEDSDVKIEDSVINQSQWVSEEVQTSTRPELTSARIVVSGGRGLKSGENFKILYDLADTLGAAGTLYITLIEAVKV
jgi:electron transfer flavoprotein alpha subunit